MKVEVIDGSELAKRQLAEDFRREVAKKVRRAKLRIRKRVRGVERSWNRVADLPVARTSMW